MHTLYGLVWLFAAYKYGNWKNLDIYYPTFLFLCFWDFFYQFFLFNHSLWVFKPSFDDFYLPNHSFIVLFRMITIYFSAVIIFLSHFPEKGLGKKLYYNLFFVLIFMLMEVFNFYVCKGITYHNGWNLWWSAVLDIALFMALRIHQHHKLLAWLFGFTFTVFLWNIFNIPFHLIK